MATLLRAVVMLIVLVGLPAAWVYYGPLPPAAMSVIQRTLASAQNSLGWQGPSPSNSWRDETTRAAPRFDNSLGTTTRLRQQQGVGQRSAQPLQPMMRDSQFALTSAMTAAGPPATEVAGPLQVGNELARQLEPHLSLLRRLNAAEYTLENWGGSGQLYRFRCAIALGKSDDHTRQFEAVDADPLRAVHQVVGEVTSWQNARQPSTTSRWQ